jgi:hypothetical protein
MSSKESQEEVKIIANLTESQSEQNKVAKQKILIPRTIDVNNTNAKLNTTAVTEINKIS